MRGFPASPLASVSTVSLGLVCSSTLMRLKLPSAASRSAAASDGAVIAQSVTVNTSMVAMLGAIIPLPLAMPARDTVRPPSRTRRNADLVARSVVTIAAAAAASAFGPGPRPALRGPDAPDDPRCRKQPADDAGRADQDLAGRTADGLGDDPAHRLGVADAPGAGRRVADAAVAHDRARDTGGRAQVSLVDDHRRPDDAVRREDAGRGARDVGDDQREIGLARRLDSADAPPGPEAAAASDRSTLHHAQGPYVRAEGAVVHTE